MAADVVVSSIKSFPDATSLALVSDLQFNEPYSSAALNRKFRGIVNTGFYGGFLPSPAGGLNLKISSGEGGGTASIDIDKYYQLTVRQQADVTMPVTAGKKVIVVLEATYALGQETYQVNCKSAVQAVEIKFLEEGTALRQNQLELCTVTVPAGATELTEEMIDVSRRRNQTVGITLSSEIDSDADHIAASSHAVKKAVKAARDETTKQIENLVDGAPASLDTLKKIADAINNDPDFFNTLAEILKLKAPLESPELTGIPTVPTPPLSVSNKQVANTEYVQAAVAALVGSSPEALDTLAELAQALGNDPNFATTMLNALSGKQPLHEVLTSLSGLNSAANKLAFFNGPNSMALANLTAVGRVLIGQESIAKVLEYLGLVETMKLAAGAVPSTRKINGHALA
uniref:phage tail protein n=1 Tax=Citrobacter freundii TaxID=546 RepID=UPI003A96C7C7